MYTATLSSTVVVMRSPCAGAALEPPSWIILRLESLALSPSDGRLLSGCHGPDVAATFVPDTAETPYGGFAFSGFCRVGVPARNTSCIATCLYMASQTFSIVCVRGKNRNRHRTQDSFYSLPPSLPPSL